MTQYGDNKCLDCKNNRKCYMRSRNCYECGVEFVCKLEEKHQERKNKLIEELEKDIEKYCGDYGTLEGLLEDTLYKILGILKEMNKDSDKE